MSAGAPEGAWVEFAAGSVRGVGRGTRVRSVASGGQAKRTGAQVGVVDAGDGDVLTVDGEQAADMGEVVPAALDEGGAEVAPGQGDAVDALVGREEVAGRVLRAGGVVVVAAEDEDSGPIEEG